MCAECLNAKKCQYLPKGKLCPPLDKLADGNTKRKEVLMEYSDNVLTTSYTEVLCSQIKNKQECSKITITQIREIEDYQQRTIAALLYAHLPINHISQTLRKHRSTIWRICNMPK